METDSDYFEMLKAGLERVYSTAQKARSNGMDPEFEIEVKIAKDLAARVEGIVGPIGIAEKIRTMEKQGKNREDVAFEIARLIASGEIIKKSKEELLEQAVRTGLGILTEGVLVAPTEGIAKVKIKNNPDGSDFVAVYYAGPIRSAGGTAVALSVLLADIARRVVGIGDYRATDTQIERYVEEINIYEARVAHLQYKPPEEDVKWVVQNCPVCVDGEPTEDIEASAFRNVPGVETNRIRGGIPLVICEGIIQKAAKVLKYTKKLKLGWDWLEKIIKITKKEDKIEIKADDTYLEGLVAGRPVFSYPSTKGGFRLRYGKSKTNCLMAKNVHPAIMTLLENFLAFGTHMKIERPGKGCVIAPCEKLDPPVVKLKDGSVIKVKSYQEALRIKDNVVEILFLGDLLITFGDFYKSNHPLLPSAWCQEWFEKECKEKGANVPDNINAREAFEFSKVHNVPLHPDYTYNWHDLNTEQLKQLIELLINAKVNFENDEIKDLILNIKDNAESLRALENLLIEYKDIGNGQISISSEYAYALLTSLALLEGKELTKKKFETLFSPEKKVLQIVNELAGIAIKAKAPTYIGARMGRPEKAKERKMDGSPNVLFPTGSQKNRSIIKVYRTLKAKEGEKTTNLDLVRMRCTKCQILGFYKTCSICGSVCKKELICQKCNKAVESEIHCDNKTLAYDRRPINIVNLVEEAKKKLEIMPEDVKGVKGLSNIEKISERLEKGFLRAKNDVYVFRDGTSRFDATNSPLTHFTVKEIGVNIERLKELGYQKDHLGNKIVDEDQIIPLNAQDIIISKSGAEYFLRVANFIDDMLVNLYGMQAFYNIKTNEDLIGHLAAGLSPHTSAAVLCRIIGFTDAFVGYAHPFFHAAKRRNCFHGDERLLVYNGGQFSLTKIREIVESNLSKNVKKDDFGTYYEKVSGLKTFAYNKETKKFELADITHVSRHVAPKKLLEIKTKSGRRIVVTPDHPFPNNLGQRILAKDAQEILIPWNIKNPAIRNVEMLDLISLVNPSTAMIRTEEDILEDTPLSEISKKFSINYKTFTNYVYRKSYPLQIVRMFKPNFLKNGDYLLGNKRDKVSVLPKIIFDDDFLSLLGFYVAEGYIKRFQKDAHQVSITATKKWAKKNIAKKIERVFGLSPHMTQTTLTICSSYVLNLFEQLNIGKSAKTKKIPSFLYSLPKEKICSFLRGYFSGDGSCSLGSTLEVNLTSVNRNLIEGVSYLLMFLGIKHSIYEEKRKMKSKLMLKFYGKPKLCHSYKIRIYSSEARKFIENVGFLGKKHIKAKKLVEKWTIKQRNPYADIQGDIFIDKIIGKKLIDNIDPYVYNLTVDEHHSLICSGITAFQCDGDEDCVMLLLDALINFSRHYLDEKRGGTMDAPLVLTPILDPKEVDDEAHAIEFVNEYPLEFYHATERFAMPSEIKIKSVKDVLGTPEQFESIPLTHPSGDINIGNLRTAYVQLDSIPDKIGIQFKLQEKIRAVDKKNAAERLILSHFIPDLYGNLRSFSRQTFRCVNCNESYRRVPLAGKCLRCGGNLLLTINKGGIQKYLEISRKIVEEYELPLYIKQRLDLVDREIKSIFEDEKIKQMGLADFI